MKGLCHGCCSSNVETTIDKDGNPKCVNCIGVVPAHLIQMDKAERKSDMKRYGYHDSKISNPIKQGGQNL